MYVGHDMIGMCSSVDVDVWRETKKDEVVGIAIAKGKSPVESRDLDCRGFQL